jgi:guanine deaminase
MYRPPIPDYIEATASSLSSTRTFIEEMRRFVAHLPPHAQIVQPVVTPRLVPTCSLELLKGLAELAKEEDV